MNAGVRSELKNQDADTGEKPCTKGFRRFLLLYNIHVNA